jgi:PhnB protein
MAPRRLRAAGTRACGHRPRNPGSGKRNTWTRLLNSPACLQKTERQADNLKIVPEKQYPLIFKTKLMATVNPYLNFNGNTEEAFEFYKSVFGGEFITLMRFRDTPEKDKIPAREQDKIMHVALPLGQGSVLMGTDLLESQGPDLIMGNNFSLAVTTESEEATNTLFGALAAGGRVTMPLQKTFWGSYFGMLTDKFGIQWMLDYDYKQQQ